MKNAWYTEDYPVGPVWLAEENGSLTHLVFSKDKELDGVNIAQTSVIKEADKQLKEYFAGRRKEFDLPLVFHGTPFQKSVWNALMKIPYGETRSYKDIAELIDNPKACRAVGLANGRNPISIIAPCHRVIGSNGSLTGYGGGLNIKQILLELEKSK